MVAIIDDDDDDDCVFAPTSATTAADPSSPNNPNKKKYSNSTTTRSTKALPTIILPLDDDSTSSSNPIVRSLLSKHSANLIDVGTHMLAALRELAPSQLAARVGDAHENLSYEILQGCEDMASMLLRGTRSDSQPVVSFAKLLDQDIRSFERSVRSALRRNRISYRGSFMRTLRTAPQPAHVDYDYPTLAEHGTRLFLAFFPLTEEGAYLQIWHDPAALRRCVSDDDDDECDEEENGYYAVSSSSARRIKPRSAVVDNTIVQGTMVYIPYGKMLIVPSDTIHGGGFKRGISGNLRFHLYIAVDDDDDDDHDIINENTHRDKGEAKRIELLQHPMNKYTERYDRRRELCERFVDANGLDGLLAHFFDD